MVNKHMINYSALLIRENAIKIQRDNVIHLLALSKLNDGLPWWRSG